jgi:hypothetical protein
VNVANGYFLAPPVNFVPELSYTTGVLVVDGTLYAVTANGCGTAPNGVWAMDFAGPTMPVTNWQTNGGNVAGMVGPTLGSDGTVYVAVGAGAATGTPNYSNSVVALEPKTLRVKASFTQSGADFNSAPVVIRYNDRDVIAVTGNDGKMYLLDSANLGTPLAVSTPFTAGGVAAGSLAAYQDVEGTWWLFAAAGPLQGATRFPGSNGNVTNGAIVAFKVMDQGGTPALTPAWASQDMTSPLAPIVVNGVLFAASSGEFRTTDARMTAAQRAQQSRPAVLYGLDPATGQALWNSGNTITSFARRGLSSHNSQVFVTTFDNTIYTFGVPIEQ